MFAKLQRATLSFVMALCLSVCPHVTIWLALGGFSWNLEYFSKICQDRSSFFEIWQE